MKKCPRCLKLDDDSVRFCKNCNTELFFEDRFPRMAMNMRGKKDMGSRNDMKIVVITGTEVKGCTYHIKEAFLSPLRGNSEIIEFTLPRDMPHFCNGCKVCFFSSEDRCLHAEALSPIRSAMFDSDLIVITAPVYGLGIPAALKSIFDHFTVHWMVHRPEPMMFTKHAVVITNCVGPDFMAKSSQRDIINALSWMGVSRIKRLGVGLLETVIWDDLSEKRRNKIVQRAARLGEKHLNLRPAKKSLKFRVKFFASKIMHTAVLKKEETPGADNQYWIDKGWLKPK